MKICLVSNLYPPVVQGGAEIYVGRLARALAEEHRVVVITTEPGMNLASHRETAAGGITVYRLAPLNIGHLTTLPHHFAAQAAFRAIDLYHPQVGAAVRRILETEQPDVVHLHNWVGLSLGAIVARIGERMPTAITLHDYALICTYASLLHPDGHMCGSDLPCQLMTRLNRWLTRHIGLVISPSHYVLNEHLRRDFFRDAMQEVLPYGLDVASPLADEGQGGGPKNTFDILYMGRVQSHKGIEVLIRAFRRLADPTLRLRIAGTGPSAEACRALAADDDRIHFYGFVSGNIRRSLLNSADCIVVPSVWPDNYPVSIQEALQAGVPVIASRIGGIPEMIRDGINGLLVEPDDEPALAAAIERLRTSPGVIASIRASGAETARLYDMRFHVTRLVDAYGHLLTSTRVDRGHQPAA